MAKPTEVVVMDLLSRTEPDEWQLIDEMYPALRRFAAVTAPSHLELDDLLREALVQAAHAESRRVTPRVVAPMSSEPWTIASRLDLEEHVVPDRDDLAVPLQRRIAISDADG